jgi:hypothetical protein
MTLIAVGLLIGVAAMLWAMIVSVIDAGSKPIRRRRRLTSGLQGQKPTAELPESRRAA